MHARRTRVSFKTNTYRVLRALFEYFLSKSKLTFFDLVYDNYNLIALQDLDTDDIEGCEFSKKFRAETSGDMEKLMACVGH